MRNAMGMDEERLRLAGLRAQAHAPGLLGRVLTLVAGAVLLMAAFAASLVVFAAALVLGLLAWGWFWWKTRALRRQLRERAPAAPGRVIEGEVIRREENVGN